MEVFNKLSGETMREYIIRVLRKNIINLNLKPGQNISEIEIAEELGVSRTPIREAFIKLAHENLLEVYPQKGTYVSLIDLNIVEEAKFLRLTLEKAIIQLVCRDISAQYIMELEENLKRQEFCLNKGNFTKLLKLDDQFHHLFFKACQKERTYFLMDSFNSHFNRVRMLRLTANSDIDMIVSQHYKILAAIKEKDAEKAVRAVEVHLERLGIESELVQQQYSSYFK
jgi:DNA-binding GntR family transcriptional regulator